MHFLIYICGKSFSCWCGKSFSFFSIFLFYVELSHGGTKTARQLSKITSGVLRRIPKKKPQTRKNLKQETPKKISLEKLPRILIETKKL